MYTVKKILLAVSVLTLLPSAVVFAEDRLSEGSLAISPFLIDVVVEPGQTIEKTITVYNTDSSPHKLTYAIQDFALTGQKSAPRFLADNEATDPAYSLSSWIKITDQPEFSIPANSSTTVTFEIKPPVDATAGGHYAGILFSFEGTTEKAITISRKLGTILLVRYGTGKPNVTHTTTVNKHTVDNPVRIDTTIENTGNVHLAPKGKHNIYNMFGRLVESVPINPNADHLLPKQSTTFNDTTKKWHAGWYTLETVIYYSNNPTLETRSKTHIGVWPLKDLGVISLLSAFIGIMLYIGMRRYNKWIISRELR